jgi:hypothetical protein
MHTYKIILTGILCLCAASSEAQINVKTEPPMLLKAIISKTEKQEPIVPGGNYKHPDFIQPVNNPAIEIKETAPVLPDPGNVQIQPTENIAATVPVYRANSKTIDATKTAKKNRNDQKRADQQ